MQDREVLDYIKQAFDLKSQGCYKQAIEMLYKTLETEIDNIEILYQLGDLYFQLHNYTRAEKYLEKVLIKDSAHIDSYKLLKEIYLRENRLDNAETMAEKIYMLDGTSKSLAGLIKILALQKKYEEIEKYISSKPVDTCVLIEYSNASYEKGDFDKALDVLSKIDEDCDDAQILIGKIYFDKNELEKSYDVFKKLERITENDEVLNYLGLFALEDENFTAAVKYFSKASSMAKNKSVYLFNLANAYFLNGWIDEAKEAYKKAIGLEPENSDYRYSLSYLYYRQKDFEKARNEVKYILELDSKHIQARVLDALLKYENKDYLGAQIILEENLKSYGDDSFTKSALAKVYTELFIFEKAEKILGDLTNEFPENTSYKADFADLYIKEKKFVKALELVEKIIKDNENYLEAYVIGAKAAYEKDDIEKAKDFAQDAIALDINCSEGYYYLSLVRMREKDFDEAAECMKRAIFYDINNPKYYAAMSDLYKNNEDIKTAFEYIKEAESLAGDSEEYKIMYKELAALNRKS